MREMTTADKLVRVLAELSEEEQQQVLSFAVQIRTPRPIGTAGKELLSLAGRIPAGELERMRAAIEEECERIDHDAG